MKVVMVNDCAYVGETLIKYLPVGFESVHLRRSRNFLDKTFRIGWKIFRSRGDVYHVHYLLQDCYIAAKLGKRPLIGHAHGSDLRQQIYSRKWGWMVKYNLRNCDKILVAQPTILDLAKKFNETSEYFPIPFDPKIFYPKPLPSEREKKLIFIASAHDFNVKGTDKFLRALAPISDLVTVKSICYGKDYEKAQFLAKELGLEVNFMGKVSHEKMNELYWESDLVLGSFGVGQLDTVAIEAMACGRPVVHHVSQKFFPKCPLEELGSVDEATEVISKLLFNKKSREKRVEKQINYVNKEHSAQFLAEKLSRIYKAVL